MLRCASDKNAACNSEMSSLLALEAYAARAQGPAKLPLPSRWLRLPGGRRPVVSFNNPYAAALSEHH